MADKNSKGLSNNPYNETDGMPEEGGKLYTDYAEVSAGHGQSGSMEETPNSESNKIQGGPTKGEPDPGKMSGR